jgi:hypothetical protein
LVAGGAGAEAEFDGAVAEVGTASAETTTPDEGALVDRSAEDVNGALAESEGLTGRLSNSKTAVASNVF